MTQMDIQQAERSEAQTEPAKPAQSEGTKSPAAALVATQRIAFWIKAGNCYSGGRIALTMYALAMARAGAEVWFASDGEILWKGDYSLPENLRFVNYTEAMPPDIDLLITDCRGEVAVACLAYKQAHPHIPLLVVAFETPNWAEHLDVQLGRQMRREDFRAIERHADMLVAISEEGARHLAEFYNDGKPIEVVYPAINTDALDTCAPRAEARPYAVFSGRPVPHKHMGAAIRAIQALPLPFDIYVIGCGSNLREFSTSEHRVRSVHCVTDAEKFALMKGARLVLAPSTFEGFGLVPGESIMCGTPVVAYDLPVLKEAYGGDVAYAKHNDEQGFAARVRETVTGPKPDMREAAARVRRKYGLDTYPERLQAKPYHAITRARLSVAMICYATPPAMVEACLASVYDVAAEINIAYGPVPQWADFADGDTYEHIRSFPDPKHKIRLERRARWQDKREMWAWCARVQTGNYQLVTGADMIWVNFDRWLAEASKPGSPVKWATPRWVNFWHSLSWWIHGPDAAPGRWGKRLQPFGSSCDHRLFGWWRHSYRFDVHTDPVDIMGRPLWTIENNRRSAEIVPECVAYHLGHILPDALMAKKHSYYAARDGDAVHGDYWRAWNTGAGPCGDGVVEPVTWKLPAEVMCTASNGHWRFGDDYGRQMLPRG